jgi:hypothetical protein
MLLIAADEETYCPKTQAHEPATVGGNVVCYRCGYLFGPSNEAELGSLLDV